MYTKFPVAYFVRHTEEVGRKLHSLLNTGGGGGSFADRLRSSWGIQINQHPVRTEAIVMRSNPVIFGDRIVRPTNNKPINPAGRKVKM